MTTSPPASHLPPVSRTSTLPRHRRSLRGSWVVLSVVTFLFAIGIANSGNNSTSTSTAPAPQQGPAVVQQEALAAPLALIGPMSDFGNGTYVVGTDILPGSYETAGSAADGFFIILPGSYRMAGPTAGAINICYWARLKDTSGDFGTIIADNVSPGPTTVTISPSDGAFQTSGCRTWQKTS